MQKIESYKKYQCLKTLQFLLNFQHLYSFERYNLNFMVLKHKFGLELYGSKITVKIYSNSIVLVKSC